MKELVFLVEEPSIKELLNGILPKVLPKEVFMRCFGMSGGKNNSFHLPKGKETVTGF